MSEAPNSPQSMDSDIELNKKRMRSGGITAAIGIVLAFSPIGLAYLSAPGGNFMSEGSGGGAVMWLMILTLPLGAAIAIAGLIRLGKASAKYLRAPLAEDPNNPELALEKQTAGRALVANLVLIPALLITEPVLGFVAGNMVIGGYSGIVVVILWTLAQVALIGYSLFLIFKTKRTGQKALLIATSLIFILIIVSTVPAYLSIFSITLGA